MRIFHLSEEHALEDPKLTLKDILVIGPQYERNEQETAEIEDSFNFVR